MKNITKSFPGVLANDSISFDLEPGVVHALVGENGAGKSTLMKILYGLYTPDSGSIYVRDSEITVNNPRDAIRKGIGMVHQHFMLVPVFSVIENIVLGEETATLAEGAPQDSSFGERILQWLKRGVVLDLANPRKRITEIMERNRLYVDLDARVEDLPVGLQQRVEILKILYRGADILIFDEPTAVLTPQEVRELFKTFQYLTEQGKSVVFISHKLDEVLTVAERITVVRAGKIVQTVERGEATKPQLAELMVGKPVLLNVENPPASPGNMVLDIQNLSMSNDNGFPVLSDVNIPIREGEIVGIAGVEGNGQSELLRAVAEQTKLDSGAIILDGTDISHLDVRGRREAGVAHIPEDRNRFGLIGSFTLAENMSFGLHYRPPFVNQLQFIQRQERREFAREAIRAYDIRTPSENVPAHALSGGNQQKAIIAREMSFNPRLLLAAQPTRGVDVGAQEFIYRQIIEAKKSGKAVLLVSADLDEIMSLSDRIGVIYKGRIVKYFNREEATKESVGFYMTGEQDVGQADQ
jgi:simple sugar transport system ATP-binding protein